MPHAWGCYASICEYAEKAKCLPHLASTSAAESWCCCLWGGFDVVRNLLSHEKFQTFLLLIDWMFTAFFRHGAVCLNFRAPIILGSKRLLPLTICWPRQMLRSAFVWCNLQSPLKGIRFPDIRIKLFWILIDWILFKAIWPSQIHWAFSFGRGNHEWHIHRWNRHTECLGCYLAKHIGCPAFGGGPYAEWLYDFGSPTSKSLLNKGFGY